MAFHLLLSNVGMRETTLGQLLQGILIQILWRNRQQMIHNAECIVCWYRIGVTTNYYACIKSVLENQVHVLLIFKNTRSVLYIGLVCMQGTEAMLVRNFIFSCRTWSDRSVFSRGSDKIANLVLAEDFLSRYLIDLTQNTAPFWLWWPAKF